MSLLDRGDRGDRGVAGERGPKGDHGQQGDEGKQGEVGCQGVPGTPAVRAPLSRRTATVLLLTAMVFFGALGWKAEQNSCLRQQPVREAGNARKVAVDTLVRHVSADLSPGARADVLAKTRAIPMVPELECRKLVPDTTADRKTDR